MKKILLCRKSDFGVNTIPQVERLRGKTLSVPVFFRGRIIVGRAEPDGNGAIVYGIRIDGKRRTKKTRFSWEQVTAAWATQEPLSLN